MSEEAEDGRYIGQVSHYFSHLDVGVIELEAPLKIVDSTEFEHEKVEHAGPGNSVGVKVPSRAHDGDKVCAVR